MHLVAWIAVFVSLTCFVNERGGVDGLSFQRQEMNAALNVRDRFLFERLRRIEEEGFNLRQVSERDKSVPDNGNQRFSLANSFGSEVECNVHVKDDVEMSDVSSESLSDMLDKLGAECRQFTKGYWTYEWCHRTKIRQFHKRSDGIEEQSILLGNYDRSSDAETETTDFRDYFLEGHSCDDIDERRRRTEVNFACCSSENDVRILSVEEPLECMYTITVCMKSICQIRTDGGGATSGVAHSPARVNRVEDLTTENVTRLTFALKNQCWRRQEGWWTYEVCFGSRVRQFHTKVVKTGKGTKSVVDQEFVLGYNNASKGSGGDDVAAAKSLGLFVLDTNYAPVDATMAEAPSFDAFVEISGNRREHLETQQRMPRDGLYAVTDNPTLTSFREFHGRGVRCDTEDGSSADGVERNVEVRYACGGDRIEDEAIVGMASVAEIQTCSYVVVVFVPALCRHAAFRTIPVPEHKLLCVSREAKQ